MSFVIGILVARFYGPTEFGQLNYVVAAASIFGTLSSLGLDDIIPRDMSALDQGYTRQDIQKTALVMRLFGGLLAFSFVLILIYHEAGFSKIFLIALILAPYLPIQAADIYDYRLRVEDQFSKIAISRTVGAFVSNCLKLTVVFCGLPIGFLAGAMTSEFAITSTSLWLFVQKNYPSVGNFQFFYAKNLLRRSWKIIVAGILIMCQARVEYFLVEKFLGWDEVGQYSAALKIFEIIDVVCVILVSVLMPRLAPIFNLENEKAFSRRAYFLGFVIYLLLIPVMLLLTFIFPFAYGAQYTEAASLLPWLFLRPLFGMLSSIRGMFIILQGRLWIPAASSVLGLLVSVFAGYNLIPIYGLLGAVATTLLGLFSLTIFSDLLFNRKNSIAVFTCYREWGYFKKFWAARKA